MPADRINIDAERRPGEMLGVRRMSSDVFRQVNLRIYEVAHQFNLDVAEFMCECDQPNCAVARVEMPMTDFADCLAAEGAAIVAPGHQPPKAEIVRDGGTYLLIRATPRGV